jgi:hypothetical protein
MSEIKLQTKINSFLEVQKSLQEIEKQLNVLSKSLSSKAESEVSDTEGKSGDIKTTRNVDGSYSFEIRTDSGWKTPVLGESSIKFKDKPASISKPTILSIDELEKEDVSTGDNKAKKNIFDEKTGKFVMPRPDYDSKWFDIQLSKIYVTGAADGAVPDDSQFYNSAGEIVGIPALGFTLERYPSLIQVLFSSYKTTSFSQSFDGKTGSSGTDAIVALTHEGSGQYYNNGEDRTMGVRAFMTNKEHIALSTGDNFTYYWKLAGGSDTTSSDASWTDVYDAAGGTSGNISCRLRLWK